MRVYRGVSTVYDLSERWLYPTVHNNPGKLSGTALVE